MNSKDKGTISRSTGVMIHPGYIVGGGFQGGTKELDEVVAKEAEILRDHFGADVTIRFNSHRRRRGAWLIDSTREFVGSNSSIGLCAKLVNSKLRNLRLDKMPSMSKNECDRLAQEPDMIIYTTAIDLTKTEHSVSPDSQYILTDSEHRDFDSLADACQYLFSHVARMKSLPKTAIISKTPLETELPLEARWHIDVPICSKVHRLRTIERAPSFRKHTKK